MNARAGQILCVPTIRAKVGDWIFFTTTLSFENIKDLIKAPDEIHERKNLADWIQRIAIEEHSKDISDYIKQNEQRFLGSLIIGVYNGNPEWSPLNVNFDGINFKVSDEEKDLLKGKLGYLSFSGEENLFAIDGQHRVNGIKKALLDKNLELKNEEINALFVAHDGRTTSGKERTRRLFTVLNKKSKKVNTSTTIALDEDNGFAIVTRKLIDNYWFFEDEREHIAYTSGPISPESKTELIAVGSLFNIVKDLYSHVKTEIDKFTNNRPKDEEIEIYYNRMVDFFNFLFENVDEYKKAFIERKLINVEYRNNLLFRPIGLRIFARATYILMNRHKEKIENSMERLLKANLNIISEDWEYILWNPIKETIENSPTHVPLGVTKLLSLINEEPKSSKDKEKLEKFIKAVKNTKSS